MTLMLATEDSAGLADRSELISRTPEVPLNVILTIV